MRERRIEPQRPRREPRAVAARRRRERATRPRPCAPRHPRGGARSSRRAVRGRPPPLRTVPSCSGRPAPASQASSVSAASSSGTRAAICRSATRRWHSRWNAARLADACVSCLRYRTSASRTLSPLGDVEQSRPEVVVLALRERRVVAQAVLVQHRPVDDDRGVEERRREQGRPPHGARAAGHPVDRAEAPVLVQVDHPRADDGAPARASGARDVVSSQRGRATSSASMRAR